MGKITRDKINKDICNGIINSTTTNANTLNTNISTLNTNTLCEKNKDYTSTIFFSSLGIEETCKDGIKTSLFIKEVNDIKIYISREEYLKLKNEYINTSTKRLNETIAEIEKGIISSECEKNKIDCEIAKHSLKSIKENCFKVKESEIDNCVLASAFSASIRVTGISQKREMEEAGKSKEAYEKYLTKSGLDFKDGICDSFNSTISSGFEGYKYIEVCKDKQKTYSFTKEVNGINISISRGEYLDNLYSSFLKGLPKLLENFENMSQGRI